jgi:hypothetical protein
MSKALQLPWTYIVLTAVCGALLTLTTHDTERVVRAESLEVAPTSAATSLTNLHALTTFVPPPVHHLETGPFIDGSKTPELIPDDVAYAHFFRTLIRDDSPDAAARQRSYARHVIRASRVARQEAHLVSSAAAPAVGGSAGHHHSAGADAQLDADVEAVVTFINSFDPRFRALDSGHGVTGEDVALVGEITRSVGQNLGPRLAQDVERYVMEQFKRKVKIVY